MQGVAVQRSGKSFFSLGAILSFLLVTSVATLLVGSLPAAHFEDGTPQVVLGIAIFFLLLFVTMVSSLRKHLDMRLIVYRSALVMWWALLVDEVYFARLNTSYNMGSGAFSILAYGEAAMWLLMFGMLLVLTMRRPQYLRELVTGSSKWLSLFVLFCLISILWAPGKAYATAWGFKLVLVVMLLQFCASQMEDVRDVMAFLKVTLAAFFLLSVVPVFNAITNANGLWEEGRLAGNPDLLGPTAASFMLLGVILYSMTKDRLYAFLAFVGAFVMFLAFGKAGIVGGVLGAFLFMVLQKKVVRSLGLMLGLSALALLIISMTPLANYLQTYQGGSTLTGRTVVWTTAMKAIQSQPLIGHGYLGTYYSWENTSGLISGAVHLHNGFLEVAYNDGLIGEFLLLMVHFMIIRNVFRAIKASKILRSMQPGNRDAWLAYLITIGMLGFYVHAFIQGIFGADFGGRCMTPYMLFLGVFMVSDVARRLNERMLKTAILNRTEFTSTKMVMSDVTA